MKKFYWFVILIVLFFLLKNPFINLKVKIEKQRYEYWLKTELLREKQETEKDLAITNFFNLIHKLKALDYLENILSKNDINIDSSKLTSLLNELWLSGKPIVINASIDDINNYDESNYIITISYKGAEIDYWLEHYLGTVCEKIKYMLLFPKDSLDAFFDTQSDDFTMYYQLEQLVFIASIDSIETTFYSLDTNRGNGTKVGMGHILTIENLKNYEYDKHKVSKIPKIDSFFEYVFHLLDTLYFVGFWKIVIFIIFMIVYKYLLIGIIRYYKRVYDLSLKFIKSIFQLIRFCVKIILQALGIIISIPIELVFGMNDENDENYEDIDYSKYFYGSNSFPFSNFKYFFSEEYGCAHIRSSEKHTNEGGVIVEQCKICKSIAIKDYTNENAKGLDLHTSHFYKIGDFKPVYGPWECERKHPEIKIADCKHRLVLVHEDKKKKYRWCFSCGYLVTTENDSENID